MDGRTASLRARVGWAAGAVVVAAVSVLCAVAPPAAAAGAVSLFDDDGGAALFAGALLAPGRTQTACVSVDAVGADPADDVVLSADSLAGPLLPYLTVTVQRGVGGRMGDCTRFAPDAGVAPWSGRLSSLARGVTTGWHPAVAGARTFRFTVAVDDVQAAAGITGTGRFVWRLTAAPSPPPSPSPSASPTPEPTRTPPAPTPPAPTQDPTDPPTVGPTDPPPPPAPAPPTDPGPTASTTAPVAPTGSPPDTPAGSPSPTPSGATSPGEDGSLTLAPDDRGAGGPGGGAGGGAGGRRTADVVLGVPLPALRETVRRIGDAALHIAREPQYPLGILALAGFFLLVQDLIDRRDPKLAAARVTSRDGSLDFPDLFPPGGTS